MRTKLASTLVSLASAAVMGSVLMVLPAPVGASAPVPHGHPGALAQVPALARGGVSSALRPGLVVPGTWQQLSIPQSTNSSAFNEGNSVSCVGPTFCVAVGDGYQNPYDIPFTAQFNGSAWGPMPNLAIPPGATQTDPYAVSCVTEQWCVAVGDYIAPSTNYLTLIEQWNGSTWSIVPSPNPNGTSAENALEGVSCTSLTFCTAVGGTYFLSHNHPLLAQWDGAAWTMVAAPASLPTESTLDKVSCVGTWCQASGIESSGPVTGALLMSGTGPTWSVDTIPSTSAMTSELFGISCYSTMLCLAVGLQSVSPTTLANLMLQWNGTSWTTVSVPNRSTTFGDALIAVDCFGPTSCVAQGWADTDLSGSTYTDQALAWDGTTWSAQSTPAPAGSDQYQINAEDCVPNYACLGVGFANQFAWALGATIFRPGYDEVASDGGLFSFGTPFYGSMGGKPLNKPIVGMAMTPDGGGYWEVASDGGLFAFGDAAFYGSMGGQPLNQPIVGMVPTMDGRGYYEVASDGGIFAFGDAVFQGSMGGQPLNKPIVGIALTPDGLGYYEVASDGGLFAFNAPFLGSEGGKPLNQPIVGMAVTPTGGYYEVATDGGLFAFNAPFLGSMGGQVLNKPIVGMATYPAGGYYEVASDGGLFAFNLPFLGSMGGKPLNQPIVGIGS